VTVTRLVVEGYHSAFNDHAYDSRTRDCDDTSTGEDIPHAKGEQCFSIGPCANSPDLQALHSKIGGSYHFAVEPSGSHRPGFLDKIYLVFDGYTWLVRDWGLMKPPHLVRDSATRCCRSIMPTFPLTILFVPRNCQPTMDQSTRRLNRTLSCSFLPLVQSKL
jgi:hypothetical protein